MKKGARKIVYTALIVILISGGVFFITALKNNFEKTVRITLQEDYYFDVTIPKGYSLLKETGGYANYIVDSDGEKLIGFEKSWFGGEFGPYKTIVIDDVRLQIEGGNIGDCRTNILSEKAQNPQKMIFGILTWCKNQREIQLPVYKQVIESIIFGPKLKDVLLGNSPAPPLD